MKTQHTLLRKLPHAALAAILSLSLALNPAYAADPAPGTILTSGGVIASPSTLDGDGKNGFFLKQGTLEINNMTLQNFGSSGF